MAFNLFDGGFWQNLRPLTHTRPVADLRVGILTIAEKWGKYLKQDYGYNTQNYLADLYGEACGGLKVCGALCPDDGLADAVIQLKDGEALFNSEGVLLAYYFEATDGNVSALDKKLYKYNTDIIKRPEDIFLNNKAQIEADFKLITYGRSSAKLSSTNTLLGDAIFIEEGAEAECCTFNTKDGSIYIGKKTMIMEGSHIRGAFALCEHASVKMGTKIYAGTTVGPYTRVGGEINNCVFWGYSAKGHDGYMGNSVVGAWCNMGAGTSNSNLKNNYANVKLYEIHTGSQRDTGLTFCGTIMADHVKCGINTMLNTGTVIGVGCNIWGNINVPGYVPDFSWLGPDGREHYRFNKFTETAKQVLARKGMQLTAAEQRMLQYINDGIKEE